MNTLHTQPTLYPHGICLVHILSAEDYSITNNENGTISDRVLHFDAKLSLVCLVKVKFGEMLLHGLLLLSLSFWTSHSVFKIPLTMFAGKFNASVQLDLRPLRKNQSAVESGLSLASDPAGIVDFLDMINNLKGDAGRGYYMQMLIGTPGQTVCTFFNILIPLFYHFLFCT